MSADACAPAAVASAVVFELLADLSPGLLPRLLQPLARRNLVPERLTAHRAGNAMVVRIGLGDVTPGMRSLIAGNLRQVVGVQNLSCRAG
ncbi:MAG: hypothetical protein M0002_07800 [Rhodospirillales bacterium]|nr:hypothetical protein [Rhodospirillales bacterium]